MKIQKRVFFLFKMATSLLVLASCAAPIPTILPQPSATPSETVTLTTTPTATHIITSPQDLYTPVPTISSTELEHMVALLQSNDCKLPCYLGITPGKTTLNEAKEILVSLGGSHVSDHERKDGATEYFYNLWVGDPTVVNETPEPNGFMTKIIHHVSLITNNDTVQIIEVYINATKSLAKFREYWSRYSAREIFLQMGPPDHLYTGTPDPAEKGSYLLTTYEKLGVVAQIYGTKQEDNICPESEAKFIDLQLSLFSPASQLSIYGDGGVPPTDRTVWLPIEEAVGVNMQAFYNRVVSDPSACFQVK